MVVGGGDRLLSVEVCWYLHSYGVGGYEANIQGSSGVEELRAYAGFEKSCGS